MQITIMSVLSIIFYCFMFSLVLTVILENVGILRRIKYEVILVCMAVIVFKMIFPMEIIPWTININVGDTLSKIIIYWNKKELVWQGIKFSRWDAVVVGVLVISVLSVIREVAVYLRTLHLLKQLPDCEDDYLQKTVDEIIKEYGKNIKIPVKTYSNVSVPGIAGVKNAVILVPTSGIEHSNAEGILRHEVAHYMHGDLILLFIWRIVKAMNWWNIVVILLDMQLTKILEVRADEKAIQHMDDDEIIHYGNALIRMANGKNQKRGLKQGISLIGSSGWLVRKRVQVLSESYQKTKKDTIINYVCMVIAVAVMLVVMNVFIFEPKGEAPIEDYDARKMVTENDSFLVRNPDGTFDMYMYGVYCATLMEDGGSRMKIYDSLEEAKKYEEIP